MFKTLKIGMPLVPYDKILNNFMTKRLFSPREI